MKWQAWGLQPLFKKIFWSKCFPVNFAKYLRTPSLQNAAGRLLLYRLFYNFEKVPVPLHLPHSPIYNRRFLVTSFIPLFASFNFFRLFSLREKCLYSEFFRSVLSCIRAKYSVFSLNARKHGPEKLQMRTLFMGCLFSWHQLILFNFPCSR